MTISDKELEDIGFIENPREIIVEYNQEQWQAELVKKYQKLYNVVQETLPNLWDSLEFEISIQKILNIKDCTLPFGGIVLGRPSSMKTVGIGMFRTWKNSFYSDKFTAKAFVSHSTAVKNKKELEDIDLLPKIRNKLFLTPELASTFTKKDDEMISYYDSTRYVHLTCFSCF